MKSATAAKAMRSPTRVGDALTAARMAFKASSSAHISAKALLMGGDPMLIPGPVCP